MPTTLAYPEAPPERGRGARVDGELKVSGQMMYADDLALPGLLYVAVVRSPYAHARIISINIEEARKVPGVHRVLTGADVAGLRFGRAVRDVPILAVQKVRFAGEMVVAVAAESHASAEEAAALVDVQYDPLPAVFDHVQALTPGALAVHEAPWSYAGAARGPEEPVNLMGRAMSAAAGTSRQRWRLQTGSSSIPFGRRPSTTATWSHTHARSRWSPTAPSKCGRVTSRPTGCVSS